MTEDKKGMTKRPSLSYKKNSSKLSKSSKDYDIIIVFMLLFLFLEKIKKE